MMRRRGRVETFIDVRISKCVLDSPGVVGNRTGAPVPLLCTGGTYAGTIEHTGAAPPGELPGDPTISTRETIFERDLGLPCEHLAQARVVAVAAAHALRLRRVVS